MSAFSIALQNYTRFEFEVIFCLKAKKARI